MRVICLSPVNEAVFPGQAGEISMRFCRQSLSRRALLAGLLASSVGSSALVQIRLDFGLLKDLGDILRGINIDEQDEIDLGAELFGVMIDSLGGAYRNSAIQTAMQSFAAPIFATTSRSAFDWDIVVVDSNEANAWALPGGKIGVNKGLLRYIANRHELAAVISHEMGHAEFSHAANAMRKKAFYAGLSTAAQAAAVAATEREARIAAGVGARGIAAPMMRLVMSGYSREAESEADQHIVSVFEKTGYDVRLGAGFYRTLLELAPKRAKGTTSLFAGHPETRKRLAALAEAAPGAGESIASVAPASNAEFEAIKSSFPTRRYYRRHAA